MRKSATKQKKPKVTLKSRVLHVLHKYATAKPAVWLTCAQLAQHISTQVLNPKVSSISALLYRELIKGAIVRMSDVGHSGGWGYRIWTDRPPWQRIRKLFVGYLCENMDTYIYFILSTGNIIGKQLTHTFGGQYDPFRSYQFGIKPVCDQLIAEHKATLNKYENAIEVSSMQWLLLQEEYATYTKTN